MKTTENKNVQQKLPYSSNLVGEAIRQYHDHCNEQMVMINIKGNEIIVIDNEAYHTSIPTTMFDYCLVKDILNEIGTTELELFNLRGQFYSIRDMTGNRD